MARVDPSVVANRPQYYQVDVTEHERGWGSDILETIYFTEKDEAEEYVRTYNARNTAPVAPDYYTRATLVGRI